MRAGLLTGPGGRRIVLDFHHIVVDAVTLGILLDELEALYRGARSAKPPLQYPDYALWQAGEDAARRREEQERFWLRAFADIAGEASDADLPTDFPRPEVRSTEGRRVEFPIGEPRTELLRAMSRDAGVTLFHTLVAVHFLFLARITGRTDLTVGTPVAGRMAPELERVSGPFANTVCLRTTLSPGLPFTGLLRQVSRHAVEVFAHQDYPFDRLVERVAPRRDYARNPLFDTMIAMQDTGLHHRSFLGGRVSMADTANASGMFDLNLQLYRVGRSLDAVWAYSPRLFRAGTVRAFQHDLLDLMDAVVVAPERRVGDLTGGAAPTGGPSLEIEFDFS